MSLLIHYSTLEMFLFVFTIFHNTKIFLGFRSGTYICDMSSDYIGSTVTKGVCTNQYEALQVYTNSVSMLNTTAILIQIKRT